MRSCGISKHLRFKFAQKFLICTNFQITTKFCNYRIYNVMGWFYSAFSVLRFFNVKITKTNEARTKRYKPICGSILALAEPPP